MDDTPSEDMNDTTQSTTVKQRPKKLPSECKICGAPALYSYYGVIVCPSCKVFFKRNAEKKEDQSKCVYDGDCEINIHNRHICTSCRLAKCFVSGMQVELIRGNTFKPIKNVTKQKKNVTTISTILSILREKEQPQQLPTLNLLRSDQSTLTIEQWNLLSNLTHCYDEYSQFSLAQRFLQEQHELPPKMRFKLAPVGEFLTLIVGASELLYEKNADFVSLCPHDRSLLLHNTMEYVTGLSTCFITRHTGLFEDPALYKSVEVLYGSGSISNCNRVVAQLDFDSTFFKLVLVILTFSTYNSTDYRNLAAVNLENIKTVLRIQDTYTELGWRYLLYKYNHQQAVVYFVKLISCFFLVQNAIVETDDCKQYTDMINSLIQRTEETLTPTESLFAVVE